MCLQMSSRTVLMVYNDPKQVVKLGLQKKNFLLQLAKLMPANLGRVLSQLCPHVLKIDTDEYKMTHELF